MPKHNDAVKSMLVEAVDGCQWCEAIFSDNHQPKVYLLGISIKRAFCNEECLETFDQHQFTELSCSYCNRELSGPGSIIYHEKPATSTDARMVRQFCSNKCCQKHRLWSMQQQQRTTITPLKEQPIDFTKSTSSRQLAPPRQPDLPKQTVRKHSLESNSSRTSTDSDSSKGPRKAIASSSAWPALTDAADKAIAKSGPVGLNNDRLIINESLANHNPPIETLPQKQQPKKSLKRPHSINEWTVDDVMAHLRQTDPSLPQLVIDKFREHEMDGIAIQDLDIKMMLDYMKIKLGPALKVAKIIESITNQKPN